MRQCTVKCKFYIRFTQLRMTNIPSSCKDPKIEKSIEAVPQKNEMRTRDTRHLGIPLVTVIFAPLPISLLQIFISIPIFWWVQAGLLVSSPYHISSQGFLSFNIWSLSGLVYVGIREETRFCLACKRLRAP